MLKTARIRRMPSAAGLVARAEQMERKLRQHYALGMQAIAAQAKRNVSTRDFAESRGLSEHTIRKLKAFARSYNQRELDQLCALRRPNGLPLHWGYVGYLLAADSAATKAGKHGQEERERLAMLAAKKNWTAPELYAAIRQKFCRKGGHGRSMVLSDDLETAVRKVQDEGRVWLRRWNLLSKKLVLTDSNKRDAAQKQLRAFRKEVDAALRKRK